MEKISVFLMVSAVLFLTVGAHAEINFLTEKWNYTVEGNVNHVNSGDLDNDGMQEIAISVSQYYSTGTAGWLLLFDKDGNLSWEKSNLPAISNMKIADVDGDGKDDIVLGIFSYLYVYDYLGDVKMKRQTQHGNHLLSIDIADLENDGESEIITGGAHRINNIYVFDSSGGRKWIALAPEEANAVLGVDMDDDGVKEVLVGSVGRHGAFYKTSYLMLFNYTGGVIWKYKTGRGIESINVADVDGDGRKEIFAGSLHYLYVLDSEGNSLWNYTTGGYVREIIVEDLDGDGEKEVIVGSNDLYVLDSDGNLKWQNGAGGDAINDLDIVDIEDDGDYEIIVGSDKLYIFDCNGDEIWSRDVGVVRSICTSDLDGDGYDEIMVGTWDTHRLHVFHSEIYLKKKEADSYFSDANSHYKSRKCKKALEYAKKAEQMYEELNDEWKLSKVRELITEINNYAGRLGSEVETARSYYEQAQEFYLEGNYINAIERAERAKWNIPSPKNYTAVAKCKELINNSKKYLRIEADNLYENATYRYDQGNYTLALEDIEKAAMYYHTVDNNNRSVRSHELMAEIYFILAQERRSEGDFVNASIFVQRSREVYLCLDRTLSTQTPDCIIDYIEIKDIDALKEEAGQSTYNGSRYGKELLQINALIASIGEADSGNPLGDLINGVCGIIPAGVSSRPLEYALILVALIILVVLVYFLASSFKKRRLIHESEEEAYPVHTLKEAEADTKKETDEGVLVEEHSLEESVDEGELEFKVGEDALEESVDEGGREFKVGETVEEEISKEPASEMPTGQRDKEEVAKLRKYKRRRDGASLR